ncbi:MAG: DGQHR domain-containing protein [Candidatus Methanosuratincola petrocarbonis]
MINLNAFRIKQSSYDVYVSVMKASELIRFVKIDHWNSENLEGYQRPLNESRVKKALKFLLHEEGTFPTSLLLNVRGRLNFFPSNNIGDFGTFGVLQIPPSSLPFFIIDGQHRLAAIQLAAQNDSRFEFYGVPVSIFNFVDRFEEMRQFYIVNNRQKSVSTDLVQRHLISTIKKKGVWEVMPFEPEKKILAAEALDIVDILRTNPDSPWYHLVQTPDIKVGVIKQTSFADAIGHILKELSSSERFDVRKNPEILAQKLIDYWNVIKEFFPKAFSNPYEYTIQKSTGCYVFCMIFHNVYSICKAEANESKSKINDILTNMFDNFSENEGVAMDDRFWHTKLGHPYALSTNQKMIRQFVYKLLLALNQ